MTWRDEQAKQTRQKILDTVVHLLAEGHPAALSVPEVSRSSGISVATIYRYFGTKEQLLDAAALEGTTVSDAIVRERNPDLEDLAPFLGQVYDDFEKIEPALRAQLTSRVGQELRTRRRSKSLEAVLNTLDRHGLDPDLPATRRLARVVAVLSSSPVYLDQVGNPRDQVLDDIAWAVRTLTHSVRAQTEDTAATSDTAPDEDDERG
jgi:AcrR family transcriptional regulator